MFEVKKIYKKRIWVVRRIWGKTLNENTGNAKTVNSSQETEICENQQ